MIEFIIPIKTVAGLNAREHYMARKRRVKGERMAGYMTTKANARNAVLPAVVTLTRLSAGVLDDDNLQGACKSLRDGIADAFGVDDSAGSGLTWRYDQERCKRGEFGVVVRIEAAA